MKKTIFVSWRVRSSCFLAAGQSLRKRAQSDQIADDGSQQIIQDESSTESIISSITSTRQIAILLAIDLMFVPVLFAQGTFYEGPVGVAGIFNGNVTTGGSYDPLTHSAHRAIDDIVVPGSIGKYPLKMTRYYNSRAQYYALTAIGLGPGWAHEYSWLMWGNGSRVVSPSGGSYDFSCGPPVGVSEGWEGSHDGASGTWRLADGGKVVFNGDLQHPGKVTDIYDPYGLRTTITYDPVTNQRTQVTEPGGRYLKFIYGPDTDLDGTKMLKTVEAHGLGNATVTESVTYTYTSVSPGYSGRDKLMLTKATYSDGTWATYTYTTDNVSPAASKFYPLLQRCDDFRYNGPMRTIFYDYQDQGPHGAIMDEKNPGVGAVSSIAPVLPTGNAGSPDTFTETRGDGPTRTFTYTHLVPCIGDDCDDACAAYGESEPHNKMLLNYTDFKTPANTTYLGYDTNWYVNSVEDARGNTTAYVRASPPPTAIGQITKITYPDNTHIDYGYQDEGSNIGGHYLTSTTEYTPANVLRSQTIHYRDVTTHKITQTNYYDGNTTLLAYETFTYCDQAEPVGQCGPANPTSGQMHGQIKTHKLKNGAYVYYRYDSGGRGLLVDKWEPTWNSTALDTDPKTHYTYYPDGDTAKNPWTDRLKMMTLPANASGNVASEAYEYDTAGGTNPSGTPLAGRGLVTKITHADGKYKSFGYDPYGNKLWEYNELGKAISYTYDDYNRVLTVKDPIGQTTGRTTTYTYTPTNGGGGSSYKHTTNNPDTVTTPTGIVTSNVYDQNFRKTSTSTAGATTWFNYDAVGNQTYVTDPRGTETPGTYTTYTDYDTRNRKWQVREPLGHATQFYYDDGINVTRIIRPDITTETKTYDAMNRVLSDTVPKTTTPLVNLTTWFMYNPSGTIWKVTDPRGSGPGDVNYTTTFAYDASDRKISMTYPGNSNQQWVYDDAGNLESRTTVGGKVQSFTYDNRNRKTGMTWSNAVDWATYGYDAAARLTIANNANSYVYRQYDDAGHLTLDQQILGGMSKSVIYGYDDDGKVNRMFVNGVTGYDFTYSYDAMGRLEKIFPTSGGLPFQYYYDAASNETERDNLNNGVNKIYPRDALNRVQYVDVIKGTTLGRETYTYDMMNRITLVSYTTGPADSFQYYLDGELKLATLGNLAHTLTYNLDNKGNRTSVVDNTVTTTYTPNTIDQYTSVTGNSISNGSEHEISAYNNVTYTYVNDEHLQQVSDSINTYGMAYDALGRCVKRTLHTGQDSVRPTPTPRATPTPGPRPSPTPGSDDVTTYYVYDGEKPILEYDADGTEVGVNLYGKGVDEILERVAIGSDAYWYTYYPQQNHEGSVTLLTDGSGNVIERYRYDAFGAPIFYTGSWGARSNTIYDNRFLFTGREYAATYRSTHTNTAFNFYEYRARAYNPKLGRFMSEDPKLFVHRVGLGTSPSDWTFAAHPEEAEFNLFRYCGNDPVDFTDPMGEEGPMDYPRTAAAVGYNFYKLGEVYAVKKNAEAFGRQSQQKANAEADRNGTPKSPDVANAARHIYGTAELARILGADTAKRITDIHEQNAMDKRDSSVDKFHNRLGLEIGQTSKSEQETRQKVEQAIKRGNAIIDIQKDHRDEKETPHQTHPPLQSK
jgi:RHS repeat-associated protein